MNEPKIKVVSIEGRWGQSIYPSSSKSPSVSDLLRKEQSHSGLRPYAAALSAAKNRETKNVNF